jgi:hypothetical protein
MFTAVHWAELRIIVLKQRFGANGPELVLHEN